MRWQRIRMIVERPAAPFWLLLVVAQIAALLGPARSVVPVYHNAAVRWFTSENIYDLDGYGFVYLPQSALLYSPFALLPPWLGDIAWRAVNLGVFAWGVTRLAELLCRDRSRDFARQFGAIAALVCMPTCFSAARNGQMTLIMAGFMLLAVVELAERRWWRAATLLTLAVGFKTLAAVLLLLVGALYRPTRWKLLLLVVGLAVMPFVLQSPDYVVRQCADAWECLRLSAVEGLKCPWATVFGILDISGLQLPHTAQTLIRAIVALATLAACYLALRLKPERTALYLFTFASLYILLFSPRTENNTYAQLGPALGIWCAWAALVERNRLSATIYGLLTLAVVSSYEVSKFFTDNERAIWLAPLAGCVFAALVVRDLARELAAQQNSVSSALGFPGATKSQAMIGA